MKKKQKVGKYKTLTRFFELRCDWKRVLSSEGKFFGRTVHVQLVCTVLCAVFGLVCSYQIRSLGFRV